MALLLGTKLRSWMIFWTRLAVSGVTRLEPLITRETVALETPANFATSRMLVDILCTQKQDWQRTAIRSTEYAGQSKNMYTVVTTPQKLYARRSKISEFPCFSRLTTPCSQRYPIQ